MHTTPSRPTAPRLPTRHPLCTSLLVAGLAGAVLLGACSSYTPPPPAPLVANPASTPVHTAWQYQLPAGVNFPLQVAADASRVLVADSSRHVLALDSRTGTVQWQTRLEQPIAAGVGADGHMAAVVTVRNQLLGIRADDGSIAWQAALPAATATAPLVSGAGVFVLTNDGQLSAFDSHTGQLTWQQRLRPDSQQTLGVQQPQLLLNMGPAVLAGVADSTVAVDMRSGQLLGTAQLGAVRAPGEMARAGIVLAPAATHGSTLCARTFGVAVSCLDYGRGVPLWSHASRGSHGLSGNADMVVGSDDAGHLTAWSRHDGRTLWQHQLLSHRRPGAPLLVQDLIAIGDAQGVVHVLDARSGQTANRIQMRGAAHTIAPVQAGAYTVLVSSSGHIQALRLHP